VRPVLADAGFLVALYDRREPMHRSCVRVYRSLETQLVTCEAALAEALYLLNALPISQQQILASVAAGILAIPFQLSTAAEQVRATMYKYRDTPADFADACLIQMAEELDTGEILTLDSDFGHYRWGKNKPFHLLIPIE